MKKSKLLVVLGVAMVLTLGGCGKSSSDDKKDNTSVEKVSDSRNDDTDVKKVSESNEGSTVEESNYPFDASFIPAFEKSPLIGPVFGANIINISEEELIAGLGDPKGWAEDFDNTLEWELDNGAIVYIEPKDYRSEGTDYLLNYNNATDASYDSEISEETFNKYFVDKGYTVEYNKNDYAASKLTYAEIAKEFGNSGFVSYFSPVYEQVVVSWTFDGHVYNVDFDYNGNLYEW